jgi:hypothetical protein
MPPEAVVLVVGKPLAMVSLIHSIVKRSESTLAVLALRSALLTGKIASPLPIPGLPTKVTKMFGIKRHVPRLMNTWRFSVAATHVAAAQ